MPNNIEFSVILPICHGGEFLKRSLKSINELELPKGGSEVLLAGPGDSKELRPYFEKKPEYRTFDLHYIEVARSSRSALLNAAIDRAKGRILVFTDDDCTFPSGWLGKIAAVFQRHEDIGVVGGRDITPKHEPSFNVALDYVLNSFWGTGGLRRDTLAVGKYYPKLWNMAISRELALSLARGHKDGVCQVFNEELDVHEDVELIDRIDKAGKRIIFAPEVQVFHSRDTDLRTFTIRSFNMARTSRSIGVHRLPHLLLTAFALGMITLVIGAAVSAHIKTVLVAVSVCYLAILAANAFAGYMQTRRPAVAYYIPFLLSAVHFGRGLGYLFPWHGKRESAIP